MVSRKMQNKLITFLCVLVISFDAQADLLKYFDTEVKPILTGKKALVIKPYISISSGANKIKFGKDAAMIKVGGITVQTTQLQKRLLQAGCVYATGDVMKCAPDVIDREAKKLFKDISQGIPVEGEVVQNLNTNIPPNNNSSTKTGLTFKELDLEYREISSNPDFVSGFNFNQDSNSSSEVPHGFIYNTAVKRGVDSSGKAFVDIVGRADFSYSKDKLGGVTCLFASDKNRYLKSYNDKYTDPYGMVAISSAKKIESDREAVLVNLTLPWSELELPADENPYTDKFVECHLTIDGKSMNSTDWMVF